MQEFQYIQDALKEVYHPVIVNQVNKTAPLWAQLKKSIKKSAGGKYYVIPIITAFPESVGAKAPNNYDLPAAQRSTYDQAYIHLKRNYGRIMVDKFSIESSKGAGGWVDVFTQETRNITNAFAIDIDRQSMMNGKGVLGVVSSVNGQVLTMKDAGGITGDTPVTKFFRVGMVVDVYTGGTKNLDSKTITAVDPANGTITIDSAGALANDLVYKEDTYYANNQGEMMGINGIISADNTPGNDFQGITRTNNPIWQAYVGASTGLLTETKLQEALDAIEGRTDGEAPTLILTTYAIRNKLIDIMRGDRMVDTLDLKAGWKAIKYIGGNVELPLLAHKNCPTGYIYIISLPHLKVYMLKDLEWEDLGGGIMRVVPGKDAVEAFFRMYANIGTDCSNAHGVLTGVTVA